MERVHDTDNPGNRETWLNRITQELMPTFADLGKPLPEKIRVSIGFTSRGARSRAIGECWDKRCSADGHFEIFIRPDLAEKEDALPSRIADILAHELVHAAVGIPAGHGPEFRKVAKAIGLTGKMTATVAGPGFLQLIGPIIQRVGPLPHARLETTALAAKPGTGTTRPKPQTRRHIKCTCLECGYTVRTTRMWIDQAGPPLCPTHGKMEPERQEETNAPET